MKKLKMPVFSKDYDYERKMIADILRVGLKYPSFWMSFQLDITALVEHLQKDPSQLENKGLPVRFLMAYAQVIAEHPEYIGQVIGNKIEIPEEIRIRISSRNVKGRTVSTILKNPHEMSGQALTTEFKRLILKKDSVLSPQQKRFFYLPWWVRSMFYQYWASSTKLKGYIFGHSYFACNGKSTLNGPFTSHNHSPFSIGVYFSDTFQRDGKHWVSISITADHRIMDAYHLTFLAEKIEDELRKMAVE